MADTGPARHLPQRELPALVLAQHVLRRLDDDALEVAVVVGARAYLPAFSGLAIS